MIDSARAILIFPCTFPVKAIGRHSGDFQAVVVAIVRRHAPDLSDDAVSARISDNGAYLAVTAAITARSRDQLDALYRDLTSHEQVLMVL